MRYRTAWMTPALVFMGATCAFAHPHHEIHTHPTGFDAGLLHPLLGIDHLLAMLTVGILAARTGGRAIWLLPCTFLASMIAGGAAGISGTSLWSAEFGIAASVVALGLFVAAGKNLPLSLLMGACVLFGFIHGHAHGAEMPSMAQPALYALGFVLATAALHLAGVGVGVVARRTPSMQRRLQFSGLAIAAIGLLLMFRL